MDAERDPSTVPTGSMWRRIPWAVPNGRRLRFWAALPEGLVLGALLLSLAGGQILGYEGFPVATAVLGVPIVASYVVAAVVAVAYGIALIVTAHTPRPRPRPPLMAGLVGNPAARRWYGLSYAIPPLIAWGVSFTLRPTATSENLTLLWYAAPVTAVACVLLARSAANRDPKRAVLTGRAPSYEMSPDRTWWRKRDTCASINDRVWWNGATWVRATAEVPDDALRSPDGNYWWTGSSWCPMPPIPRHRKGAAPAPAPSL